MTVLLYGSQEQFQKYIHFLYKIQAMKFKTKHEETKNLLHPKMKHRNDKTFHTYSNNKMKTISFQTIYVEKAF